MNGLIRLQAGKARRKPAPERTRQDMKRETIAIHSGYDIDPTTKAVAVPIYQTVAYAFDSTDHAAALFNLEAEGFRYTRIQNPTTAVLERRVAALEGGLEALVRQQRSGGGELCGAKRHRTGKQHRFGSPALRHHPHPVRLLVTQPGSNGPIC